MKVYRVVPGHGLEGRHEKPREAIGGTLRKDPDV